MRKSRFVGREKLDFPFVLTMSAYNLVRMRNPGALGLQKRVSNASFRWKRGYFQQPAKSGHFMCLKTGWFLVRSG